MKTANPTAGVTVGLNAVIVAVTDEVPRILIVPWRAPELQPGAPCEALPFGPLDPMRDRTLELGLRRWVREQSGLALGYVEQLYTFGDRDRESSGELTAGRALSIGYLALVKEGQVGGGGRWRDCYSFFPWEDRRQGTPPLIVNSIEPALSRWVEGGHDPAQRRNRRERADIAFGLGGSIWDGERVLDRYELLYEAGLVEEARRDLGTGPTPGPPETGGGADWQNAIPGRGLCLDHRRILATALGRLRGKIRYRPVVFELLPSEFTLFELQKVVESLAGVRLHKQNFRRLLARAGLVEGTGRQTAHTGGRPAELFRFRREVLRERPAPGVGLPAIR
jgi:hypothetical protein